jgi:hypothetical protein
LAVCKARGTLVTHWHLLGRSPKPFLADTFPPSPPPHSRHPTSRHHETRGSPVPWATGERAATEALTARPRRHADTQLASCEQCTLARHALDTLRPGPVGQGWQEFFLVSSNLRCRKKSFVVCGWQASRHAAKQEGVTPTPKKHAVCMFQMG